MDGFLIADDLKNNKIIHIVVNKNNSNRFY